MSPVAGNGLCVEEYLQTGVGGAQSKEETQAYGRAIEVSVALRSCARSLRSSRLSTVCRAFF